MDSKLSPEKEPPNDPVGAPASGSALPTVAVAVIGAL